MIFSKWLDQRLAAAKKYVLAVSVVLVVCVGPLYAQDQQLTSPKVEGKFIFGSATFGEDIEHKMIGAALRVYVTKRISIEPEYMYYRNTENDQDHSGQLSVAYDFTDPTKRAVFYAIGGVGGLHHEGSFIGTDNTFDTWTASGGVGIKIFITKKLFVSPELRLGREPTVRATINVGYVFGGRN
jgi:hypothetical protein